MEYSVIGERLPRVEGVAKATGEAKYTADLSLPRMLYGKILRSPHPHARILKIDTSRAERLPGVKAVIIGKDTPRKTFGLFARTADQYPLAMDKVRFIGDEIAAVAALDEDIAEEALGLIDVEYEILPAVFDPEEAMKDGASLIHEAERNISARTALSQGDLEKGFREADYIREDRFVTGRQAHSALEPHAVLATCDASGRLTLWMPNMGPFIKRALLSRALNKPVSDIRLCKAYIGGAFGGKSELFSLDFCASLLSLKTGRPVKIVYSREEVFLATRFKHPMTIWIRSGVKKDGTFTAREARVMGHSGAYHGTGILAVNIACTSFVNTYRSPNIRYEGFCVYTNTPVCGALRGHGSTQMRFADESQIDMIAEELGVDAVEMRLKNARRQGDVLPNKAVVTSCALSECIRRAVESAGWYEKRGKGSGKRGIGIGCTTGYTAVNINRLSSSAVFIKFNEDGKVNLLTGAVENGQGTETMLAQIAAEELGLPIEDIVITAGDTELTPVDVGSFTMALTFVTGTAVKRAAEDARQQLMEIASERLGAGISDMAVRNRRIYVRKSPEKGISLADAVRAALIKGMPILGKGYYMPRTEYMNVWTGEGKSTAAYTFCAQVAEVEVDRETGGVKLLSTSIAHDCGYAINPMDVEGQIEGASVMAQGMALSEETRWDEGRMLNPSLLGYKIPLALDVPRVKPIIVESLDPEGPYGGKEVGESAGHLAPSAVANAVYDAIGVRIKDLPLTPEKILKALAEKSE